MNRQLRLSRWHAADATTDGSAIVQLDFTGMARSHQASSWDGDASAGSNLQQRLSGLRVDRNVIGHKLYMDSHRRMA